MNIETDTLEKYLKLPLEQRERFAWWWPFGKWYISPYCMEWEEWDGFKAYVKEHYPLQYWIRYNVSYHCYSLPRNLRELKYKIKHKFRTPRKEMRNLVFPAEYQDLQTHIVNFHIQCVIEYVEREKCFEMLSWDWNEEVKRSGAELREAYDYCKTGRAVLEKELQEAWDRVPFKDKRPYEETYKEVNEKEAQIKERDTKLCKWVVDNREILWT